MKRLVLASALALFGASAAQAATYNVTTKWYEPDETPKDSIFIGSFDYDASTHTITNLKGILSESMAGSRSNPYNEAAGPGNWAGGGDNMTWLGLDNTSNAQWGATQNYGGVTYTYDQIRALQAKYNITSAAGGLNNQLIPSWYDASLGGTFAVTFRNTTTSTCYGGTWSPQDCADVGGIYANYPKKALNPGNAYALIFVPDSVVNNSTTTLSWNEATGTGDLGLAYAAYADFVPTVNPTGSYDFGGGMMGAVGMTGWSVTAYGAVGTMGGYPLSEKITLVTAVPEPETYAMLLAGLGMIGAVVRRRYRTV